MGTQPDSTPILYRELGVLGMVPDCLAYSMPSRQIQGTKEGTGLLGAWG